MTIGVLGGGQLGRMLALAGLPWELKFRTLDPSPAAPMATVAEQIVGEYEDFAALADFVSGLDAVTYEFENVPVRAVRWLAERVPVFPTPAALEIAQDRQKEKEFFCRLGAAVAEFSAVESRSNFESAINAVGIPSVLKTRRFGYDGKGQYRIRSAADAEAAWQRLGGRPLILERLVPFDRELSVIAVRGADGNACCYPLIENHHRDGILRRSLAPVSNAELQHKAEAIAKLAMNDLNYVGVLAIEFFAIAGELFVNEMAPRVHNSGHWTIEGATTSQFANHLRAGLGWPLGKTDALGHVAMINLISEVPDAERMLAVPGTSLHLYGKQPRPGRKLGHVTLVAASEAERNARLRQLEQIIEPRSV